MKCRLNWSANTDPQLQEAGSPQWLRSGCLQRYPSSLAPTAGRPLER